MDARPSRWTAVLALRAPVVGALLLGALPGCGLADEARRPAVRPPGAQSGLLGAALQEERVPTAVSRIAFGSCAAQDRPQPVWDAIAAAEPDLMILLGDNVYADSRDPGVIARAYADLAAVDGFAAFRKRVPLLATWDDHDYGENDAGADFPAREASRELFLDFFEVPADSPRRAHDGVHGSIVFGPPGRRVQVLLLDTRSFRSPIRGKPRPDDEPGPYRRDDDPAATILGEDQWAWLELQLRRPAELRLLCSSIQVVAEEHGWEGWSRFPRERRRLLDLIASTGAEGVVVLSGDRHHAELSMLAEGAPYPLFDATSSSLNKPLPRPFGLEPNRHRLHGVGGVANFGLVEVDWEAEAPSLRISVRDDGGAVLFERRLPLALLSAR